MDAFGFRFVWITSEGKSLRPANARGKHLRNRGPGSRRGDQPNRIAASRLTSNRGQRSQWLEAQSSAWVEPVLAASTMEKASFGESLALAATILVIGALIGAINGLVVVWSYTFAPLES